MLTINSPLSIELAEEIAADYDVLVEEEEEEEEIAFGDKFALEIEDKESDLQEELLLLQSWDTLTTEKHLFLML